MLNRRDLIKSSSLIGLAGLAFGSTPGAAAQPTQVKGFHQQGWFHTTSFDMKSDLAFAKSEGKILTLLWEQQGCSFCKKMHEVAFQDSAVVDLIRRHFLVLQMDMWGARSFNAMNGEEMNEAAIARSYIIRGTPSAIFFDTYGDVVFQLPGYAEPPVFLGVFQYVQEKGYDQQSFRDWYKSRG